MHIIDMKQLDDWLIDAVMFEHSSEELHAYVVGLAKAFVLGKARDFSNESLVLAFIKASDEHKFQSYQQIGDWSLWTMGFMTKHVKEKNIVESIGRSSYFKCWSMLRGSWVVFEELADTLPTISEKLRSFRSKAR